MKVIGRTRVVSKSQIDVSTSNEEAVLQEKDSFIASTVPGDQLALKLIFPLLASCYATMATRELTHVLVHRLYSHEELLAMLEVICHVAQPGTSNLKICVGWEMPYYLLAKDLILQIAVEFIGSTVESLTMEERMTLCNMVVEAGGKNDIVPADAATQLQHTHLTKTDPSNKNSRINRLTFMCTLCL